MPKKDIVFEVNNFIKPIIEKYEYELVDVEYLKEGSEWYLRIYIDKLGGINHDDCKIVSKELSESLDKEDSISQAYFLEVSSPGLDRPLKRDKDFDKYKGVEVEVKLFKPLDNKKVFEGKLLGLIDNIINIEDSKGNVMKFERASVATVKRTIRF